MQGKFGRRVLGKVGPVGGRQVGLEGVCQEGRQTRAKQGRPTLGRVDML